MIENGTELTLYNFITAFMRDFQDPQWWDAPGDTTMPQVEMRLLTRKLPDGKMSAHVYIVDVKAELIRFSTDDKISFKEWQKKNGIDSGSPANRDKIREICINKGVPYVEFMRGNSWIQDAQFDIVQDELIQSIFIQRYMQQSRAAVVGQGRTETQDKTTDHRSVLYSSAIKGQVTTIGNHGMDIMGLYWLDFGVPQWSGPFRVLERQDIISKDGWQCTIHFISDGMDPLGSQGRPPTQEENDRQLESAGVGGI
jgi:hypothetical protein